ncbi:MAG: LysR family transcriptional regulator [Labilithrix sp.]|nr:LysR family transcriptional regulator [Labilithrix sp.]MCW5818005.1 LysR family transcriptional regulator [Labilithrix sp.]
MSPSLDDLSIFLVVARAGSISAAATKLRLPKSTVSRALGRLEAALGVTLIHRTTRRSRLSSAGEALLEQAAPLVGSLDEALARIPGREETPSGLLRVTCTIDFGAIVLAELVSRFVARHPAVEVEVHATNAVVDLIEGGFDLGLRFSPRRRLGDSSLVARRVGTLHTLLVASPKYLGRRGAPRSPRDLGAHDWVTYTGAESIVLETPRTARRLAAHGRIRCDDMFFARAAALAGAGLASLPSFLIEPDIAAGTLVRLLPKWQVPSGVVWLVHPASRNLPPKLTAFRDFVIEALSPTAGALVR